MAAKVNPIPDGYHGALPYLVCKNAANAIEFYKKAFGATEVLRMEAPGGGIGHAEIRLGEALIMLSDECPEMGSKSPHTLGGTSISIYMYVNDVDAFTKRAVDAGAIVKQPLENKFYGDRAVGLEDPFGHLWGFATHIEDVPPEELSKRMAAMFGGENS